ncbi:MAG: MFS transporter [Bacteroidales bacterium]
MHNKQPLWTRSFILLALANLLMAIAFYFMLPVLPVYLEDVIGAGKGAIGVVLAFYTIAALIIRLFAGWAIDSYGRKRIYLASYLLFSILFIGYPLAFSVIVFMLLRFAHGLAWGALTTSSSTLAVDIIPTPRRGEGIGFFGLSMTIGMAIGPLIAIQIVGDSRYFAVFISAIILTMLGILLAIMVKYPSFNVKRIPTKISLKKLIAKPAIPISLNMMLIMFTYGGILSFIALYAKEIGISNSGPFFLVLSLGIGLSRIGSGKIFDKKGPLLVTVTGCLFLIAGFPVLSLYANAIGFHIAALIIGLGFGIIMPTFQAMINNVVSHERRGAANSTFLTCFDLGIGLGMVGTGFLSEWFGFKTTFLISSLVNLIALFYFMVYSSKQYKKSIYPK